MCLKEREREKERMNDRERGGGETNRQTETISQLTQEQLRYLTCSVETRHHVKSPFFRRQLKITIPTAHKSNKNIVERN